MITLSPGRPERVRVTSRPRSSRAEEYSLRWEVVSLVRPEEYRILYRPVRPVTNGWTTSIIQAADTGTRRWLTDHMDEKDLWILLYSVPVLTTQIYAVNLCTPIRIVRSGVQYTGFRWPCWSTRNDTPWWHVMWTPCDWHVTSSRHEGVVFAGSFTFSSLAPGSEYEVMVQARSELGWSAQTQPFRFSTPR